MEFTNAKITAEFENLGRLVWAHVPTFRINAAEVREAAERHGFDGKRFKECSPRLAMSRAVKEFHAIRQNRLGRRIGVKETESGPVYVVTIVEESADPSLERLSYEQTTTGRVNTKTGEFSAEGPLAKELLTCYSRFSESVTDEDFRLFFRALITECRGISKRVTGGIYFVPSQYAGAIQRAADFLKDLAIGAQISYDEVFVQVGEGGANERRNLWQSAEEALLGEVDELIGKVSRITKRIGAVKAQEAKMNEMRELMDMYTNILGQEANVSDLLEKLGEAESLVQEKMSEIQGSVSAAPVKVDADRSRAKRNGNASHSAIMEALKEMEGPVNYRELARSLDVSASTVGARLSDMVKEEDSKVRKVKRGMYEYIT